MELKIKKDFFLETCQQCMMDYASKISVLSAIGTMSSIALSRYEQEDVLPEAVIDTCLYTLFGRISIMKGKQAAEKFEAQVREALQKSKS